MLRMGENIFKGSNRQGINLQNIQTVCGTQDKKQTNNPINKWVEDLNRDLSKDDIWMAKKHME